MKYKAMPGSVIIQTNKKDEMQQTASGLFLPETANKSSTEIAEILSVGDERDDLKAGGKILFPTSTGLKIANNIYYLKYEDICAIIGE
jgi:co-chaperonin GroES (HSP10)